MNGLIVRGTTLIPTYEFLKPGYGGQSIIQKSAPCFTIISISWHCNFHSTKPRLLAWGFYNRAKKMLIIRLGVLCLKLASDTY